MSIFDGDDDDGGREGVPSTELHQMELGNPGRKSPPTAELERLLEESERVPEAYDAIRRLTDQRVRNQAREELQTLYGEDFDIDHAPGSIDRYEKTVTLERLRDAVVYMGTRPSERPEKESDEPSTEQAVQTIEQMKTYGELAEPHLAHLASASVMTITVREAAVDALADVRAAEKRSTGSLREALAEWLRPGGD